MQPARSSIVDVARLAGVSVATVSRALRGLPNVSEATRGRVLQAASDLEYIASPLAAALVTGRTHSVGVVASAATPWFFTEAVRGIEATLRDAGYDVLLHVLPAGTRRDQFFTGLPVRRRVDGLVLVGLRLTDAECEALMGLRVPLVAVEESLPGVHTEHIDNRAAGALAVQHLIDLGHTRIGLIGFAGGTSTALMEDDVSAPSARHQGALRALRAAGLEPVGVENGDSAAGSPAAGAAAMARLLEGEARRPSAVFCQSDEMAFGALHTMHRLGLSCPGDVSVIGFDDHELAETFELTTVAQPVAEQGAAAARWLVDALDAQDGAEQAPPGPHEVNLVVRGTTARVE